MTHLLAAKVLLDDGEYKRAAAELRFAADAAAFDPKLQAELRALAQQIEQELPESQAPAHLVAFAGRLLLREVIRVVVPGELQQWSEAFREQAGAQLADWEKAFPAQDDLN